MKKVCTSIEQSQKLIELGIDVNTADMFYADIIVNNNHKYILHLLESYGFKTFSETKTRESKHLSFIPAWSLSALLSILTEQDFIIKTITNEFNIDIPIRHCKVWFSSLFDATFEMVVWLLKNKKL